MYAGPGNGEDAAMDLAVDASGNVYVAGRSAGSGTDLDFVTIKYNAAGVEEWVQRYNGPGNGEDAATAITLDAEGNICVTGYSTGIGTGSDYLTVRYDPSGNELWRMTYNGPGTFPDEALAITTDAVGNIYVTGRSGHTGIHFDWDYATIKYSSSGVQQWVARYNGAGNDWDQANSVVVDDGGNVYVTGTQSIDVGTAFHDYATIKYNSSGVQQWVAGFNGLGNNWDEATVVGLDGEGNVYVTGYSSGSGTVYDFVTIKYDPSGTQQWLRLYNTPGFSPDVAYEMVISEAGDVYISGASSLNFGTIKYNSAGVQQWVATYDENGNFDAARDLAVDDAGNVYVTGVSARGILENTNDYATVKYDPSGVEQWVQRYNGAANGWDEANAIALDAAGNVYVTGSVTQGGAYDFGTIRYSITGIPCAELSQFLARCTSGGTVQARVILLNNTGHVGETITIMVDDDSYEAIIVSNGTHSRAQITVGGYAAGNHTVQLSDPQGCFDPIGVSCLSEARNDETAWALDDSRWEKDAAENDWSTVPVSTRLLGNYPNPFNPSTTISYDLAVDAIVRLVVYDPLGREVMVLIDGFETAGRHEVVLDGSRLASGIYFYRLTAGSFSEMKKLVLVK
jgi:uncharacterized delta-60 repeat protein